MLKDAQEAVATKFYVRIECVRFFSRQITEEFVQLLQEDHGEVLREQGDVGDEHVKIEDRLISASLRADDVEK